MQKILDKFGLDYDQHFLGSGTECKAFHNGDGLVYKIYGKYNHLYNLKRLQEFYNSLDTSKVLFKTPIILEILDEEDFMVVIERKLNGICPTSNYLNQLPTDKIEKLINNYSKMLFQIKDIQTNFFTLNKPLNTTERFFIDKEYSSWKNLLIENLVYRYVPIRGIFEQTVINASQKFNFLVDSLQTLKYKNSLIHGDLFQENILIDEDLQITSIFDFGGCTTIGDYIFDITLGWALFDKYKKVESVDLSGVLFQKLFNKLSKYEQQKFAIYLLTYCFISANMFANNNPMEQRFRWCVANLNNPTWWNIVSFKT
jgi:serine/threonine protein kinase